MTPHDISIAALLGVILPPLFALIIQSHWQPGAKAVVAFILCVAAAVIGSLFTDRVDFHDPSFDWVAWFTAIYVAAMTMYARFYSKLGPFQRLAVESDLAKPPPPG